METLTTGWYRIALTAQEYSGGELAVLRGAFMEAYVAGNAPAGMALFGVWSEDRRRYYVYASPGSTRHIRPLLLAYSAKPSAPLHRAGLTLLYGDEAGRFDAAGGFEA